MGISDLSLGRRDLTLATAAAAAAIAAPSAAQGAQGTPGKGRHRLRPVRGGVTALDLRLDDVGGNARTVDGLRTPVLETSRFSVLGVTWRSGGGPVRARWRRVEGGWTDWQELPPLHDRPDRDTDEGRATPQATDLTWAGPCDAVQLELAGDHGEVVLALIHPDRRVRVAESGDGHADDEAEDRATTASADGWAVNKPPMRLRKAWGADPRLRNGEPAYNKTIKQAHVHHTVNSNSYGRKDVPGLIRSMYRYHTNSLGWSDIGYNFLVDRFGRIWVGRAGGVKRNVRGAHTLGFNHNSFGVAVIGNFEGKRPNKRIVRSVARLAAWKLDKYGRKPRALIEVTSWGSDKYADGETVKLPVIDGHRHTNDTACPGQHLFEALPRIRRLAARRIRRAHVDARVG
ncbi:MAG TPA: peptidoglycan recognition protein [Nocardioides sp.]|nr:peptidoglycan recognition protein [Nocardioides sp.]